MAINPSKLLPTSALAIRGKEKTVAAKPKKGQTLEGQVLIIRTQVIKVEKLISSGYALKYRQQKEEEKERLKTNRAKREEELEEKKAPKEESKGKLPGLPRLGFLDRIKNFIGNMLLAFFVVRLIDHLPKLVPFVKALGTAADFLINVGGKLLDGLVTFIDWGYKAYDATRGFVKNLFGEDGAKQFDQLSGLLNKFLNLAIIAGMIAATTGGARGGGGAGAGAARSRPGKGGRPKVTTSGGRGLGRPDIRNPLRGKPKVTMGRGGKGGGFRLPFGGGPRVTQSKGGGFRFPKLPKLPKLPPGISKVMGVFGKSIGYVALIPIVFDVVGAVREGRYKDAARTIITAGLSMAVFNLILGASGAAAVIGTIGSGGALTPVAIATLVGGGALATGASMGTSAGSDFFLKKLGLEDKPKGMKGGGITRGGKAQGGIRRTGGVSGKGKIKRKTRLAQKPKEVEFEKPGADIGGTDKILGIFPKPQLKTVEDTGKNLGKSDYFGPILAISSKITLGQKPTSEDYKNVGLGINLLFSDGINKGQIVGGIAAAYAEGGFVDKKTLDTVFDSGDITDWISSAFKDAIETNAQRTLRMIKERKAGATGPAGVPGKKEPGSPDTVNIQGGDTDFWTLVAVASREDGDPQAWADVAQSIYNRLASGAYSGKTIKDLILGQMQYEPTWKFPKPGVTGKPNPEWYSIKDAASAGVAAGQSEGAMKKVAAAILDPALQKNARDFVQGRTDFRGYSVSGGVQRKVGDNYFGWYNNYSANKIGSVPNFGATATAVPGGVGPSGSYTQFSNNPDAKKGSKLAGELGRFLDSKGLGRWGSGVHQHPEHLPWNPESGHSPGSLHYASKGARAIDIGGYGRSRGHDDQDQILAGIVEFNKMKGVKPVQLLKDGYPGHDNHVHVAYHTGKVRSGRETIARILKDERVLDSDTSTALDKIDPKLISKLNLASSKSEIMRILQSYASYESMEPEIVEVQVPVPMEMEQEFMVAGRSGMIVGGDNSYDPFAMLDRLPG